MNIKNIFKATIKEIIHFIRLCFDREYFDNYLSKNS